MVINKTGKAAVAIMLLALLAGGWLLYGGEPSSPPEDRSMERRAAVAVEVAPVQRGTIRDLRTFTGTLYPHSEFVVAPKISGRLERLTVDIGDWVERGQVIAELDDDEFVQQVEQARAELAVAEANLEEVRAATAAAQREYERIEALRRQRIASEAELDAARVRYQAQQAKIRVAQAQVAQRQAALKAAQVRLAYTRVHAAWQDGGGPRVVGERFATEGATLAANAPIVSVLDVRSLIAVVFVAERDYPRLAIGQAATLTVDALPGRSFPAEIARLAPLLRQASRQARVEIRVPNPDGLLRPGMFTRVHVQLDRQEDAILVPIEAMVQRADRRGVFVADLQQKTARFMAVDVGITEGERVQITAPPLSGHVVTLGQHLLDDGASIVVSDQTQL